MMIKLKLPEDIKKFPELKAGEPVLISGEIFVARDAAHKRLFSLINENKPLPFDISGATIYYAGPCPAPEGFAVGSVGPTSSYRMDKFTPALIGKGLKGMIGKGERSKAVYEAITEHKAVYFAAIGGAGALYAGAVEKAELIAYPELLSEAIYRYGVKDFPAVVAIDSHGNSIY